MKNRISKTVEKYGLLAKGDKVLIALSGGADSVMLAVYLLSVKDELNLSLEAAHIEHGIRGAESVADMDFCSEFCKKNDIPLHILRINAVEEAEAAGLSVEEYSRNRRYEFFATIPCDKIATAHNATDNAETLLFRLARGSSLKGLCAIPPKRDNIIRPLIEIGADEIRNYLDENGISYCVDTTNANSDYTRNFIRNEILPRMCELNPDFVSASARAVELLSSDEDYLESVTDTELQNALEYGKLSLDYLRGLPQSILGRVITEYLKRNDLPYDYFRITQIKALIDNPSRFQINDDYFAVSDKNYLRIANVSEKAPEFKAFLGKLGIDEFLNVCKNGGKEFAFCCDYDKIIGNATARTRLAGDKISPQGRGCTKTIKKLFNELSVPFEKRDSIPVIADGAGVIGICGYCVDERVSIDENTKCVLTVNIQTEDN